ncbi:MAG: ketopantoate reductase family protein [Methanophagales archaeon]|nr:ketopantoate reductase family protein [Methanophagales archaeon]MCW3141013.1 ketopantoate reductase family protein [Methanophagales archaeon]
MKILVMGAGALGSAFGGMLANAGYDVTLIGRESQMKPIRDHGLRISGIWGSHVIENIRATSELKENYKPDVILLTTKSFDTENAMQELQPLIDDDSVVISLQNGIGNEEIIGKYVGEEHTMGGMVITGFEMPEPGEVEVTVSAATTKIGELNNENTPRLRKIVAMFNDAGIPSDAVDNIRMHIWAKALYSGALNPLSAIFRVGYGELANPYSFAIIEALIHEAFEVAEAEKVELFWNSAEEYLDYLRHEQIPRTEKHHSSMLNDIQRGKKTEIDFLNGVFVALGKKHDIPTPVNETIVRVIKFLESPKKPRDFRSV